jgi:hypothetical protein
MSANKVTRAQNRYEDYRAVRNQTAIFLLYNSRNWLSANKQSGFRKRKSMNCSCKTCRGWARDAKQFRYDYQLEKSGMKRESQWDVRPDI